MGALQHITLRIRALLGRSTDPMLGMARLTEYSDLEIGDKLALAARQMAAHMVLAPLDQPYGQRRAAMLRALADVYRRRAGLYLARPQPLTVFPADAAAAVQAMAGTGDRREQAGLLAGARDILRALDPGDPALAAIDALAGDLPTVRHHCVPARPSPAGPDRVYQPASAAVQAFIAASRTGTAPPSWLQDLGTAASGLSLPAQPSRLHR